MRPTANRVREALFSILADRVAGARVLDAYAGTGALGFEALSRGAASVVFAEVDGLLARSIERNAASWGVASATSVMRTRVADWVEREEFGDPFDLVLADPPYDGEEADVLLRAAAAHGLVTPGGWIVLERPARAPETPACPGLPSFRRARYGDSCLHFHERPRRS